MMKNIYILIAAGLIFSCTPAKANDDVYKSPAQRFNELYEKNFGPTDVHWKDTVVILWLLDDMELERLGKKDE